MERYNLTERNGLRCMCGGSLLVLEPVPTIVILECQVCGRRVEGRDLLEAYDLLNAQTRKYCVQAAA